MKEEMSHCFRRICSYLPRDDEQSFLQGNEIVLKRVSQPRLNRETIYHCLGELTRYIGVSNLGKLRLLKTFDELEEMTRSELIEYLLDFCKKIKELF